MIRYRLLCAKGHEFEAWFASSAAYDRQAKRGQVACAVCGSPEVSKALMTPSIAKGGRRKEPARSEQAEPAPAPAPEPAQPDTQRVAAHRELATAMRKLRAEIEAKSEYVGPRFPEEARKIHHDEVPPRGIHGEATREEAEALREEGIEFFPMPILPEDHN